MLNRRSVLVLFFGLAPIVSSLQAQIRSPSAASETIASRLFVEFVLEQAGFKTTGIPALRSDWPADLKLGIALRAPEVELVDSRLGRLRTGLAIALAMIKKGESVGPWLKNRASNAANAQLSQLETTNEMLVNKAFTLASASDAIQTQSRVRASIAADLASLERDFRSTVTAVLSKEPGIGALATGGISSQELAASRTAVRRLLSEAAAKRKP